MKDGKKEVVNMRTRLIVAIVFAAPVLYFAMSHMIGISIPLPEFLNPGELPYALLQLCLTVPVLFAGSRFFRVGFKTLVKGAPNMDTPGRRRHGQRVFYTAFTLPY